MESLANIINRGLIPVPADLDGPASGRRGVGRRADGRRAGPRGPMDDRLTQRTRNRRFKNGTRQVEDEWRDSDGNVTHTREREYDDEGEEDYDSGIHEPDDQPGVEGAGHNGNDNCGWNPMSGCTKKSVKIWQATVQPGAHQDTDGRAAGPSLGQEAVTNTGDSTFDSGVSGGGGGDGQPDPCRIAGCGGPGPIGPGGDSPAAAS